MPVRLFLSSGDLIADRRFDFARDLQLKGDLVAAADAMIYLSDLTPLLCEARRVLVPDGLLAFTLETHGGEGVILGERLRYAHGAAYLRASVEATGLTLSRLEQLSARNEDNVPVPGLVAVATKP
jgi:predicted TPR repeat methyltransferase